MKPRTKPIAAPPTIKRKTKISSADMGRPLAQRRAPRHPFEQPQLWFWRTRRFVHKPEPRIARSLPLRPILIAAAAALALAVPAAARKVRVPPATAGLAGAGGFFTDDPDAPSITPKGYDVTVVEYLDYQCPYCRS